MTTVPTLYVMAGPNGCGKSTLTRTTWFGDVDVIDPDAISQRLVSEHPGQAAREALRRRRAALSAGRTHLVETTLSGSGILRHMEAARRKGYRVVVHYVSLNTVEQALDRIRNRVLLGGHDIPEMDARRRFVRSHANLPAAIVLADEVFLYDNVAPDRPHREITICRQGSWLTVVDVPDWAATVIGQVMTPTTG